LPERWAKICFNPSRNPMVAWETLNFFKFFPVGCFRPLGLPTPGGRGNPEGISKDKLKYPPGKPGGYLPL